MKHIIKYATCSSFIGLGYFMNELLEIQIEWPGSYSFGQSQKTTSSLFCFQEKKSQEKVDGLAYRYYCHVSLSFSNMIEEKITDMNIGGVVIFTKSLFIFLLLDVYLKGMSWISSDHNPSFLGYFVCINLHWYLICFIKSVRIICCEQHGGRATFGDGKETIGCWAAGRSPAALSLSCW